jgi:tetratricopeptide (TPR) repeat protein/CHAT domain-containing protein
MVSGWRTVVAAFHLIILAAISGAPVATAQTEPTVEELRARLIDLDRQQKHAEAIPLAEQYVAATKRELGEDHRTHMRALGVLGLLYARARRYGEAEVLFQQAIALEEKALAAGQPKAAEDLASDLDYLGAIYVLQHRSDDAEPLYRRALAIKEQALGPDHPDVAVALGKIARLQVAQSHYADAEPLFQRALAIKEKALGPDHADVAATLGDLARLAESQRRYADAEQFYRRALAIKEKVLGPDHAEVTDAINKLAFVHQMQNHYGEAEALYKRGLAVTEKVLGEDHPDVRTWLDRLANVYSAERRYAEEEPLRKRALAIMEKALGPEHSDVRYALESLAEVYRQVQRDAEVESLLQRALAIAEKTLGGDHPSVRFPLAKLAVLYKKQGRYADAEPLYRRALALAEKERGADGPQVEIALQDLIDVYKEQARYADAEPLMRRALAMAEKKYAPDRPDVVADLALHFARINLGRLLHDTNRLSEAEALYRLALAGDEKRWGPVDANVFTDLDNLAALLHDANRLAEAEALYRRALAMAESYGPNYELARVLNGLANLLRATNRVAEAEAMLRRALGLAESFGYPPHVASVLEALGLLLQDTNRLAEAEAMLRRALAIDESSFGPEHPNVAAPLDNLAGLLQRTSRFAEAEPLYRRALAIGERSLGADHPKVALRLNNLARLLKETNRSAEAEPLYRRALAIDEASRGPDHPNVAIDLTNLAEVLKDTNRAVEAEPLVRRSLAINEKSYGPDHPDVAVSLNNLGILLWEINRPDEARPLLQRALAIGEKSYGPDHPGVATFLSNLAALQAEKGDWGQAVALYARAKPIVVGRRDSAATSGRNGSPEASDHVGLAKVMLKQNTRSLRLHARALHHADAQSAAAREEGFELAQWALQTDAAEAVAQMSARFAKGEGALVDLVRQRQNVVARRQSEDKQLLAAVGRADTATAAALRASIAELDHRLDGIDTELAGKFPDYAELANAKPLAMADVQALLTADEALIVFLDLKQDHQMPGETLVWVLTRQSASWRSIPLDARALADSVAALRCGLDQTLWYGGESSDACQAALGTSPRFEDVNGEKVPVLPFDLARSHALYQALLGPFEPAITGKHLLIVPSGALTSLPFNVLVTKPPKAAIPGRLVDYRQADWLGTRQPISMLPSVASLRALRRLARTSRATMPYLGIGNPLLDGQQDDPQFGAFNKRQAQAARDKQACARPASERILLAAARTPPGFGKLFRGAQADIEQLRQVPALPETADELCEVGRRLGVPESEILLGAHATEAALKDLSEQGRLADYRVLHFATHGALAGQVQGSAEPGLILTPPAKGTRDANALERDDGFLTASEIATLKLDADWVILSACNTAGSSGETAEALSGMARAFFYAGTRALLVSHWEVGSDAAVKLTTRAFAELQRHPRAGRADALRLSMQDLLQSGSLAEAHPSQWAPFVLVGEGGAEE